MFSSEPNGWKQMTNAMSLRLEGGLFARGPSEDRAIEIHSHEQKGASAHEYEDTKTASLPKFGNGGMRGLSSKSGEMMK